MLCKFCNIITAKYCPGSFRSVLWSPAPGLLLHDTPAFVWWPFTSFEQTLITERMEISLFPSGLWCYRPSRSSQNTDEAEPHQEALLSVISHAAPSGTAAEVKSIQICQHCLNNEQRLKGTERMDRKARKVFNNFHTDVKYPK